MFPVGVVGNRWVFAKGCLILHALHANRERLIGLAESMLSFV